MKNLFDPFLAAKEVSKGTGLGLIISHCIIERHGRAVKGESTKGKGSSILISLPLEQRVRG